MASQWAFLRLEYERPNRRFAKAAPCRPKPPQKVEINQILPNIAGLRTDEQLGEFLQRCKADTVLINFGSSWCHHCHEMFPAFVSLARQFPQLKYALAQVDYLSDETVRGITYTPTFAVYKQGRKVDQFYGANAQQLRDHVWLHSQAAFQQ